MAKAKKSESADKPAAAKKSGGAKSKKPDHKPAAGTGGAGNLLGINTDLAASAAAMAVGNKALLKPNTVAGGEKKESSTFKQLKQSMSKPAGLGSILGESTGPASKKSNQPFGGGKQVGHNQTFGADVTRSGVPRRTPG